ncbi:nuclear receptor subfamily 0 group B member 2 [Ambystoma mexicanum]|uniref:nuclear receptor subfamily 0 group B member 2 n=1 Tax=Ambystoma mexicanum TaxID=8296 RepID=UPI0037E8C1E1
MEVECRSCHCGSADAERPNVILYTILSQKGTATGRYHQQAQHGCQCEGHKTVRLSDPARTCQEASGVLVKTVNFVRNVPSFGLLPREDQLLLLETGWAPLFILGLAQEKVGFEVTETRAPSMLKRILLDGRGPNPEPDRSQATMAGVQRLQSCLSKIWSLDLSPKEYAYLKGAILFNPDVPCLQTSLYVENLQREAQGALQEVLLPQHPGVQSHFARILLSAATLRAIPPALISDLFFRPIIGSSDIVALVMEMLYMH